jgi:phospholipid/cholesterol/gamma-HCH transport system substrate-binding protein
VEISLEKKVKLPRNTRMVVRSGSLISGAKDIDLELGAGPGFQEAGDTLTAAIQVELSDYIDPIRKQVESLITSVDTLMLSMSDLIDRDTRKNLQATIANLNGMSQSLNRSLQSSGSLNASFANLAEVTGNLKKSNEAISALLHNLADVSDTLRQADLKALVQNADKTFAQTASVFEKINQGQGTAGQLVVNDSLYNSLNSAVASLDSLLTDLKAHPKRYVHLSVFGKSDK